MSGFWLKFCPQPFQHRRLSIPTIQACDHTTIPDQRLSFTQIPGNHACTTTGTQMDMRGRGAEENTMAATRVASGSRYVAIHDSNDTFTMGSSHAAHGENMLEDIEPNMHLQQGHQRHTYIHTYIHTFFGLQRAANSMNAWTACAQQLLPAHLCLTQHSGRLASCRDYPSNHDQLSKLAAVGGFDPLRPDAPPLRQGDTMSRPCN